MLRKLKAERGQRCFFRLHVASRGESQLRAQGLGPVYPNTNSLLTAPQIQMFAIYLPIVLSH